MNQASKGTGAVNPFTIRPRTRLTVSFPLFPWPAERLCSAGPRTPAELGPLRDSLPSSAPPYPAGARAQRSFPDRYPSSRLFHMPRHDRSGRVQGSTSQQQGDPFRGLGLSSALAPTTKWKRFDSRKD